MTGNACGGKGGGIFVLTGSAGALIYIPCEMDSLCDVAGALVENNGSVGLGGGICIEKSAENALLNSTQLDRCIVRNNTSSQTRYSGIAITNSFNGTRYGPRITNTLIENHTNPADAIGVLFRGVPGRRLLPGFKGNTVRSNGGGVQVDWDEAGFFGTNVFSNQANYQFLARDSQARIHRNEFDGAGGATPLGISVAGRAMLDRAWENNITRHQNFGLRTLGGRGVSARRNWWGNAAGPKVPGGQQPAGADTVSPQVIWQPPTAQAINLPAPALPNLTPPATVAPPVVTFRMPGKRFPDRRCDASGSGDDGGIFPEEPSGGDEDGGNGSFFEFEVLSNPVLSVLPADGRATPALKTNSGDLIIMDDNWQPEAVVDSSGEVEPIDGVYFTHADRQLDNLPAQPRSAVRAPCGAWRPIPRPAAWTETEQDRQIADVEARACRRQDSATGATTAQEAIVEVNGWPLLALTGPKDADLDLSGLEILLDARFQRVVVIGTIDERWTAVLRLALFDEDFESPEGPVVLSVWYSSDPPSSLKFHDPASPPVSFGREVTEIATPAGRIEIQRPRPAPDEPLWFLSIVDFRGGEAHLMVPD